MTFWYLRHARNLHIKAEMVIEYRQLVVILTMKPGSVPSQEQILCVLDRASL